MDPDYINPRRKQNSTAGRFVIDKSGTSLAILGIHLLQVLQSSQIATHHTLPAFSPRTIQQETGYSVDQVLSLACFNYDDRDVAASIAYGSITILGMSIIPCSIITLCAVANSYKADLLPFAAHGMEGGLSSNAGVA
jgi:4-hydroxy-3-polyprenylbenzoate decarboxylase